MNKLCTILIAFFLFASGVLAQTEDELFVNIQKQFNNGNSTAIAKNFSDPVYCTFSDSEKILSRSQFAMMLKDFMKKNPVNFFEIRQTQKDSKSSYVVARYASKNGKRFKVIMSAKPEEKNPKSYVYQIQFIAE